VGSLLQGLCTAGLGLAVWRQQQEQQGTVRHLQLQEQLQEGLFWCCCTGAVTMDQVLNCPATRICNPRVGLSITCPGMRVHKQLLADT